MLSGVTPVTCVGEAHAKIKMVPGARLRTEGASLAQRSLDSAHPHREPGLHVRASPQPYSDSLKTPPLGYGG